MREVVFQEVVMSALGVRWGELKRKQGRQRPGKLGEACGNKYIDECRKTFGNVLEKKVCSECKGRA